VHEVLQREIEDICAAMSLCYRQEVTFYEFEYFPLGQHQQILSATYRRRRMARARIKIEELIHATALADGGLQKLVSALRSTKSPDAVHRAISFLAGSYETDLEVAYFMAFSAMETVLGSCGEQDDLVIVADDKWNRLERSLRETLAREGNALAMSVEHLLRRLPELKRPSLAQRMARICENFGAKSADLWPDEGFADGFARAVATRNGLFHAAKDIANQSAHGDLVRIRTLTERLILKLLDWPEEKLWVWRDDWLGRVNCP
jgi:hypothetical protein